MFRVMNKESVVFFREISEEAHYGQKRDCGGDYFDLHVARVADQIRQASTMCKLVGRADRGSMLYMIALAYMHDVIEDCDEWMEKNDIHQVIASTITDKRTRDAFMHDILMLTTSGERASMYDGIESKGDRITALVTAGSVEAICVKFSDRINNLDSMSGSWNEKRQMKYLDASDRMLYDYIHGFPRGNHPLSLPLAVLSFLECGLISSIRQIRYDLTKRNS